MWALLEAFIDYCYCYWKVRWPQVHTGSTVKPQTDVDLHDTNIFVSYLGLLLSHPQRSIRPQVVTTFELPGCHDMWTVISNEVKEDKKVL